MSILREHGTAYLAMRRSLGYKLDGHGRLLMKFIGYLEDQGHGTVTTEAALSWAAALEGATQAYRNQRLSVARCFARYLSAFDPACQVPPPGLTGPPQPRPVPYLYSPEDISALIHAAGTLASPLQAATFQALLGLEAVTGLRPGEAVALDAGDVDLDAAVVTVHGKYDRTRLVPHIRLAPPRCDCASCSTGIRSTRPSPSRCPRKPSLRSCPTATPRRRQPCRLTSASTSI